MTRDPYSLEAEQAVLGAMLQKPELIDILSADLKESDFFYGDNRDIFKAIMALRSDGRGVDYLTVSERIGKFDSGDFALGYVGDVQRLTPSVANAKSYAQTVIDRSIDRSLVAACYNINEIAESDSSTEDKIAMAQAEILSIHSGSSESETITGGTAMKAHIAELERRESLDGEIDGLSTGIPSLDKKIKGLKPEGLYIVAGRPKMGKTTFAMNVADFNAVTCKKQVLVYSLEMSHRQLMDKTLASIGGIPLNSLQDGSALRTHSKELLETGGKIDASGLVLYDRKGATINRIRSTARRHKMRHGLDLIVVDHLGLVDVEDVRASSVARISEITRSLKLLAKELGVPIIALSQLNRELEKRPNKRPIPSDLRDSGTIEQDADMILFVYRDEVYNENTEYPGVAEIIIGVAREVEACTQRVRYQGKYSLFSDLANEYEAPAPRPSRRYADKSLVDELLA